MRLVLSWADMQEPIRPELVALGRSLYDWICRRRAAAEGTIEFLWAFLPTAEPVEMRHDERQSGLQATAIIVNGATPVGSITMYNDGERKRPVRVRYEIPARQFELPNAVRRLTGQSAIEGRLSCDGSFTSGARGARQKENLGWIASIVTALARVFAAIDRSWPEAKRARVSFHGYENNLQHWSMAIELVENFSLPRSSRCTVRVRFCRLEPITVEVDAICPTDQTADGD